MLLLSAVEARVLGSLIEKESTTPEYYPMTLNGLVNACNQKSSREPVMSLDDMTVLHAIARLRDNGIVEERSEGGRVSRYAHRVERLVPLTPPERAAICVLLLRGPQTTGEIRGRSGRLHEFRDPAEVESVLNALMTRPEPVVTKLGRVTGHKENRYAQLLTGPALEDAAATTPAQAGPVVPVTPVDDPRLAALEAKVEALRRDVDAIKERLSGALAG